MTRNSAWQAREMPEIEITTAADGCRSEEDRVRRPPRKGKDRRAAGEEKLSVDDYLHRIDEKHGKNIPEFRTVRIIARSTDSDAAKSVWKRLEAMRERGVKVVAVFTKFRRKKDETGALAQYAKIFGPQEASANLRIARFRNAQKVTEQLQLGDMGIWSEVAKSKPSANSEPDVVCDAVDDAIASAARVSFQMVFAISDEVTGKDLKEEGGVPRLGWRKK